MKLFETDVLMVCYQQAAFLEEALRSALAQTYQDFRIIAVDDGSTDGTFEILENYRKHFPDKIKVCCHAGHANRGITESYRLALSEASATFTAFLEGDDFWEKTNLERKIAALRSEPETGVVFSSYAVFGERLSSFYWNIHRVINRAGIPTRKTFNNSGPLFYRNNISSFSNFVTRRELLNGLALPESHGNRLDWWLLAHLSLKSGFYFLPEKLCYRRIHGNSVTSFKWNEEEIAQLQEFRKALRVSLGGEPGRGWREAARRMTYGLRFAAHCFLKNLFTS